MQKKDFFIHLFRTLSSYYLYDANINSIIKINRETYNKLSNKQGKLLRIAQVYDIPIANNIATADFMIHSTLMNEQYSHQIENFKNTVDVRVKEMQ